MILVWIITILVLIVGIGIALYIKYNSQYAGENKTMYTAGMIATIVITLVICCGILWWLYNTEGGKRTIKDTQSNISGGIERVITVYDIDGEIIKRYEGRFDVEYNSERIKFDDEEGKRHVIYYTTGTVTIDEK